MAGRLFEIIFEADTPAGKWFDIALIVVILLSVLVVMLDSVASIRAEYGRWLYGLEWLFTILFTIEYILRLLCVGKPVRYAVSFFGIVDLMAILPTYLSLVFGRPLSGGRPHPPRAERVFRSSSSAITRKRRAPQGRLLRR